MHWKLCFLYGPVSEWREGLLANFVGGAEVGGRESFPRWSLASRRRHLLHGQFEQLECKKEKCIDLL